MTSHATARSPRATEQQKARGRVVLLTLIGLVCPPLAGVRSVTVWIFYALFFVVYSLWASRLVHSFSRDRRLGYLLSVTDTATVLPLLVWTPTGAIRGVLIALCVAGLLCTVYADGRRSAPDTARLRQATLPNEGEHSTAPSHLETSLERALRVRLHVYEATQGRFALIVLRVLRFQEMADYYGPEAADRALAALGRRGLRQLGADGQHFFLPEGRVAFVFSTGSAGWRVDGHKDSTFELVDPYDVESFAMALGRKVCEHLVDGHRVECVVGWASAPADGLDAEDLLYAAESGAQSTAAFRRVAGTAMQVANTRRVAAG
jgi:GGDEF domain-containing protein